MKYISLISLVLFMLIDVGCVPAFEPDNSTPDSTPSYLKGKNEIYIFPVCVKSGTNELLEGGSVRARVINRGLGSSIESGRELKCQEQQVLVRYDDSIDLIACFPDRNDADNLVFDFDSTRLYTSPVNISQPISQEYKNATLIPQIDASGNTGRISRINRCYCGKVSNGMFDSKLCDDFISEDGK